MLEQKVAVVTGASRGIGRAIAEKLAEEGVFVVINYRGNEEQAKQVQQTIKEQGGNAGIYGCDVSDFSACEAFFKDVIETGVIGLTRSAARELASRGITVNAVAPGFIKTEMTEVLSEQVQNHAKSQIPLGSFGNPEDVAEAVWFLASDKAGYITGQVLNVDGGMAM